MSPTGRHRGYALIEVLVAATLLGVVLTVLIEGFGHGTSELVYLGDRWTAMTLARGLAAQPDVAARSGQGRFDYPFDRFTWEIRGGRITVSWPGGGSAGSRSMTGWLGGSKRVSLPAPGAAATPVQAAPTGSGAEPNGTGAGS